MSDPTAPPAPPPAATSERRRPSGAVGAGRRRGRRPPRPTTRIGIDQFMSVELRVAQGAVRRARAEVEEADAAAHRRGHRGAHHRRRHRRSLRARDAGRPPDRDRRQPQARQADGHREQRHGARVEQRGRQARSWSPGEGAQPAQSGCGAAGRTASPVDRTVDDRHPLPPRRRGLRAGSRRGHRAGARGGPHQRDLHPRGRRRGRGARGRRACASAGPRRASPSACIRIRRTSARAQPGRADGVDPRRASLGGRGVRRRRDRAGLPLRLLAARRPAARCSPSSCRLRARDRACRSSSTRARPTRTRLRCWPAKAPASAACSTASPAASTARGARWTSGFHLSLAGIVTFPKATDLHEVAAFVPRGSAADRDRQPVSGAGAAPRQAQRAGLGRPRRRRGWRALRVVSRAAVVERRPRNALQLFGAQALARVDTPRASML